MKSLGIHEEERATLGAMTQAALTDLCKQCVLDAGAFTVRVLVLWCVASVKAPVFQEELEVEALVEEVEFEWSVAAERFGSEEIARAGMESLPDNQDAETEAMNSAQRTVAPEVGWPSVSHIPATYKAPGRFARAFPLSFPRGYC